MKPISLFLALSVVSPAADFMTGQAARITIGQVNFTAQDTGGPSAFQFGAVSGIAYVNNHLIVVDSNRIQATPVQNRVLIFNKLILPSPAAEVTQGIRCPVCLGTPDTLNADVVLGQPDFASVGISLPPTQTSLRTPTGVASDGTVLAVADTDNNRVLIWKTIPTTPGAPADIVIGQPDFKTTKPGLDSKTMRGPQGVWIQGTRLFVADTQNHRVLAWNSIPTSNGQPADYVLGEPDFNTAPPATTLVSAAQANNLFSPVSVTSDGQRLLVTDLGHNRVLIWSTIPTQTQQPADLVLGQADMTTDIDNSSTALCASNGMDSNSKPTYPARCAATLSIPRFALSDGKRLFIADGGNDRVLVYNTIPTLNGQRADVILGQPDEFNDVVTDSTDTFRPDSNILRSSANTVRTPLGLAWDGTNLFVSDPFDRRVLAFTLGDPSIPLNGITNSASRTVFALGSVTFGGTIKKDDTVTIMISTSTSDSKSYTYTILDKDTLQIVIQSLADMINGKPSGTPDPNVLATPNPLFNELLLTSKLLGTDGNNIAYSTSTSTSATITAIAGGANLNGGQDAAEVPPGTLVTINGTNLADTPADGVKGVPDSNGFYPSTLAGVQVYFDGIRAPLLFVSPTQINTQIPFEVADASGISAYVRIVHSDGSVTVTAAIAVPIVDQNPGIFANEGSDPRPVMATHFSSNGIAVVSVDGSIKDADTATITIEDRGYTYTVKAPTGGTSNDTLTTVRDQLVAMINSNTEEKVVAQASGQYTRIILTAKVAGPDGNGIAISGSSGTNANIIITALNGATCCASAAGSLVTENNPATPGEVIAIFATGVGLTKDSAGNQLGVTGQLFNGPVPNTANIPVDNAQVGGRTANVLNSGLVPGLLGVYEVDLQLSTALPTNPRTQMYIAQSVFTSNIVTIPIVAPTPP